MGCRITRVITDIPNWIERPDFGQHLRSLLLTVLCTNLARLVLDDTNDMVTSSFLSYLVTL